MAEVPEALIVPNATGSAGENENVAPLRFDPVTVNVKGDPASTAFGATVEITGTAPDG